MVKRWAASACALAAVAVLGAQSPASGPLALVRENTTVKISNHVYVIPDHNGGFVPNIGIVVGTQASLVVDTGLGPVNAQTVLREVAKVSRGSTLYVVSTHYHPEHAAGEMTFPDAATIIRARVQQQDIDELGSETLVRFRGFSSLVEELLVGVEFREADTIFEREHELDLGGVRVRLLALGPTHTRGDTMVFVEDDGVLLAGDVVMNERFPVFSSPASSVTTWLGVLDELAPLHVSQVVPSHGAMGDASLIDEQRAYLETLQMHVREQKDAGRSVEETTELLTSELQARYPGWTGSIWIAGAARAAYREAP